MNIPKCGDNLMLEQLIKHQVVKLKIARGHGESYIQVSQQCCENRQINIASQYESTVSGYFSLKNVPILWNNKEQLRDLLHSTIAECRCKGKKQDKLKMSEWSNFKLKLQHLLQQI